VTPALRHATAALAAAALAASAAAEPKRIYIANDDHTDYMWTADAEVYAKTFVEMLDFHMDLAAKTANNPPPLRNRFNADGNLWLWEYERKKSPAEFDRLMERVKDGTITAPLNTVVACYGGQPVEAVLRGMYYPGRLERRYDLRFPLALAMENQTLPLGLASLFAGSGAKYSWRGVCGCASKLPNKLLGERDREVYWWTGPDGQRVLMKWYSYGDKPKNRLGGYLEADNPVASIRTVETEPGFLKRYVDPVTGKPYAVVGLFGYGGDDLGRKTGVKSPPTVPGVPELSKVISSPAVDHFPDIAKRETTPDREVIVSNEVDFFEDFEKRYGKTLDSHAVTYGNEWDLYSASLAETTGKAKRAVEKLRTAEMLSTLVSLKYPTFMDRFTGMRDRAFQDIGLYWEHNWTADGPVSRGQRAAWGDKVAADISYYVDSLQTEAATRLGGMIPRPENATRFFVLNPLGHPRTGPADFPYTGAADVHVRDLVTGKDVPHQLVKERGVRSLRILAADVPPAGYKVFEVVPGPGTAAKDDAATVSDDGSAIENAAIKLVVERDGAVRSLVDKRRGNAELAATINGLKANDLAPNSDAGEPLRVVNRGPVSVTVVARSDAGLDHETEITVYRDSDRIDVRNEITQNFADVRHWAFGFALDKPAVHTEEVGAVILAKRKADGGDYADRLARYDYVSANHFADVTAGDGRHGVTLSNPDLAFAKLGASTVTTLDAATPQLNVLAGGQVDGRSLGIRGQNGQTRFLQRFALRPHGGYDPAAAMRFALDHQNPLVAAAVVSNKTAPTPYPEATYSLLSVSDPNALLWAVKPAEDGIGKGVTVRLWNLGDKPTEAKVSFAPGIGSARRTTHVETDLEPLTPADGALTATFARQQLQTYRLTPPGGN
jgi:alpha-mannosidase